MFIVAIEGGLGNQMFQYAFFMALQEKYEDVLMKLDLSLIRSDMHNGYELQNVFGICQPLCSAKEVIKYSEYCSGKIQMGKVWTFIWAVRRKLFGRKKSFFYQTNSTKYDILWEELDKNKNYYFKGVWANYKYFSQYEEAIRKTFVFPQIVDEQNLKWKKMIEQTNSVSIHFRGGDYYKENFTIMGQEYYTKAIGLLKERFEERFEELSFFIFTNDLKNAKKNIGDIDHCYYVDNNQGNNSYIDMQLMSLCKHNIMANSTFSFWGAYLNSNDDKVVIGPQSTAGKCSEPYWFEGVILL